MGFGIATDNNGNAYVTGFTESPDFPATAGAFQGRLNGIKNAFLSVISTGITGAATLPTPPTSGGAVSTRAMGLPSILPAPPT